MTRRHGRRGARRGAGGFTLLEVMIALAILSVSLVVLLRLSSSSVRASHEAKMLTIATGLARYQMLELDEKLLRDGFPEITRELPWETFEELGHREFRWMATIEKVELPNAEQIENQKEGEGDAGSEPAPGGSILGFGGTGAEDPTALGAGMVQAYFPLVKPVLEASIRRVTLTVAWNIGVQEKTMSVVCFFTNSQPIEDARAQLRGAGGTQTGGTGPSGPSGPTGPGPTGPGTP